MTGFRASPLALTLGLSLALCGVGAPHSASGQQEAGVLPVGAVRFDIPAQPLPDAVKAFGQVANMAVLVDSSTLPGRTSMALNGNFPPREALRRLLAGTGLEARFPGPDEAIIEPAPAAGPRAPAPPQIFASDVAGLAAGGPAAVAYASALQARLTEALCESPVTRPGAYRLLMQLDIGATGAIAAARLLGSTGDSARDAAIERAVGAVELDGAPPPSLPEPVTILLRAQTDGVAGVCP